MSRTLACWRFLRLLWHVLDGVGVALLRFPRLSPEEQQMRVQAWAQAMLRIIGVSLRIVGQPPVAGPMLLVANHSSWLDISVLHATRYCRFVSKSDVQSWPLVSVLARAAGTLYLDRNSRRDTARVVRNVQTALQQGEVVAIFPEGTTGDGHTLRPFHPNLLQAAIAIDAPVQPVGLCYLDKTTGKRSFAPTFTGNATMLGSLWRTLRAAPIEAVVHFGPPERAQGRDRRTWSRDLHATVDRLRQP